MIDKKFRAWDKATNRMLAEGFHILGEVNCFQLIERELMKEPLERSTLDRLGDVEIMQWVGRKDKMNRDIYDGDIIDDGYGNYFVIKWFEDNCQFMAARDGDDQEIGEWCIVVGNIFTTPELLNK